jgi:hypothetical protein
MTLQKIAAEQLGTENQRVSGKNQVWPDQYKDKVANLTHALQDAQTIPRKRTRNAPGAVKAIRCATNGPYYAVQGDTETCAANSPADGPVTPPAIAHSCPRRMFKNLKEGQESSAKRQGDLRRLGPHRSKPTQFPPDDEAMTRATWYQSEVRERLNRLMVFSGHGRRLALKVRPE